MLSSCLRKRILAHALTLILLLVPIVVLQNLKTVSIDVHRNVCGASNANMISLKHIEREYWPTEEWRFSTPFQQNMNESRLNDMLTYIAAENYDIDCVIIVRNGYIVLEEYLNPEYSDSTLHPIFSCTKSVVSALIGIAIEEGIITGVDQKVLSFFPNRIIDNLDARKQNITLEHLLTMTSGLEWNEFPTPPYGDPNNSAYQMRNSPDWIQYILNKPMVEEPGTKWNYCGGNTHLLSVILQNLTGPSLDDYWSWISTHLIDPIGIGEINWEVNSQEYIVGPSGIQITPRDMAKFGYLYLNNGTWDGDQVIPESWVRVSSQKHINTLFEGGVSSVHYGYKWWIYPEIGTYAATGYLGQNIMIIPEHDMVVVFASSLNPDQWPFRDLVADFITPAAIDSAVSEPIIPMVHLITIIAVPILLVVIVAIFYSKKHKFS